MNSELRQGVLTGVIAALGEQKPHLKYNPEDLPELNITEIEELNLEVSNEIIFLRDAGLVSTETFQNGKVQVSLDDRVSRKISKADWRLLKDLATLKNTIPD